MLLPACFSPRLWIAALCLMLLGLAPVAQAATLTAAVETITAYCCSLAVGSDRSRRPIFLKGVIMFPKLLFPLAFHASRLLRVLLFCSAFALLLPNAYCQVDQIDSATTMLLHMDGNLNGEQGQSPTQSTGVTYETGIFGSGAYFASPNQVYYQNTGIIDPKEGSIEFWVKPRWNGSDGMSNIFLSYGGGGGIVLFRNNTYLRSIFNRYGAAGGSEVGVGIDLSAWQANQWHHVAYTWSSSQHFLMTYVDGILVGQANLTAPLPSISQTSFQIGADGTSNNLDGVLDELRISNRARTAAEVSQSYVNGLSISSLSIQPSSLQMYPTWTGTPHLTAITNMGTVTIPDAAAPWSTSNASVATVDATGVVTATGAGSATITATIKGVSSSLQVTVTAPVLAPTTETPDPYLTVPATGYLYQIPVVIIRYLPTADGVHLDSTYAGTNDSLATVIGNTNAYDIQIKYMLEEGSRYHGYKDASALPSLGYRVVKIINVYEPMPVSSYSTGSNTFYPDYAQILTRFNSADLVNNLGVKEFWLWGYQFGNIAPAESKMSSPLTGDISNSIRYTGELPVYNTTYTLYHYNFTRTAAEAVHDHGHQLEATLGYAASVQDGNSDLFWHQFVGEDANGNRITGRAGDTHSPPNTIVDYDWENPTFVLSDIEDWNPLGTGAKTPVNNSTWDGIVKAWPYGVPPAQTDCNWYTFWFQNMPGRDIYIPHPQGEMTNWWRFAGDWDGAITSNYGLWASSKILMVPSQYSTIQAAINAATSGDTVSVADGTYTGPGNVDLDFGGKNITVTSQNGPTKTSIDCQGSSNTNHRGFYLHSGETNAVITGFTIKNGYVSNDNGAGIFAVNVGVTVQNCLLTGNTADGGNGAGIFTLNNGTGPVAVSACSFTGNTATYSGAGLFNDNEGSTPITVSDSTFTNNTASYGAGIYNYNFNSGSISILRCILRSNTANYGGGGALYNHTFNGGPITLTNSVISSNTANGGGGGIYNDGGFEITNCTITGNITSNNIGGGLYNYFDPSSASFAIDLTNTILYGDIGGEIINESANGFTASANHCDIQGGYSGTGNIDADPLFVNSFADLHLQYSSPCLGAGVPYFDMTSIGGIIHPNPPSIGAYELSPISLPTAPNGLQAVAGNAQVVLTWTAPTGLVTSYTLYRGTSATGLTALKSGITTTSFTNILLKNGTTYYYAVAAVNSAGTGPKSSTVSATPQAPPAAPTSLQAVAGNTQVVLTWVAPTGPVASYTLYRGTSASTLAVLKTGITTTTFTNVSLKNGTTYYYAIAAVNSAGTGPKSSTVSAIPLAPPSAPTHLQVVVGTLQATLTWTAPAGTVISYTLYRGTSATSLTVLKTGITTTSFTNVSLKHGTTYYYTVKAVNASGTGPASNEVSATP